MIKITKELEQEIINLIKKSPAYNGLRDLQIVKIVDVVYVDVRNYSVSYSDINNSLKSISFFSNTKLLCASIIKGYKKIKIKNI